MDQATDQVIRSLRVVYGGLAVGILTVLGIAAMLKDQFSQSELSGATAVLFGVLGAFALGCVAAYGVAERTTVARAAGAGLAVQPAEGIRPGAVEAYRQLAVLAGGLIEGPSFFAGVIYLLTGSSVALGVAGLGVAVLLWRMPSRERLERFAERMRERW